MILRTHIFIRWPIALIILFILAAGGCSQDSSVEPGSIAEAKSTETTQPTANGSGEAVLSLEEGTPATTAAAQSEFTAPAPRETLPSTEPSSANAMTTEEVGAMLSVLLDPYGPEKEILEQIAESGDQRFVSVLLELMRARQIGIIVGSYDLIIETLEGLSGQSYQDDWPSWVEWYGQSDLQPPPGFTSWKGQLLGRLDSKFSDFLSDEFPSRIRTEEIVWGGVGVDGIPPLENAPMIAGQQARYLLDEEPVFGVVVNDEARAYPLRIIDNHEMANDIIGGVPVSIAYCTLCGAAIAYEARGLEGEPITFGTSGFLYRSNKLMYDRPTQTLWNQLTGEPVLGSLADSDIKLDILPIVLTSWSDWLAQHPDTLVLDRETGVYPGEFYESGVLYGQYFASDETMFPVWQRSELLEDKDFVYTLFLEGVPKAYDLNALAAEEVVNDTIGQTPVVLVAARDTVTVDGVDRRSGSVTYTNGGEVRAFDRGQEYFEPGPTINSVVDSEGRLWQVTEEALIGPDGQTAPRLNGHLAYWFGWYAFFPETELYPEP